jgi:hypothetical protein
MPRKPPRLCRFRPVGALLFDARIEGMRQKAVVYMRRRNQKFFWNSDCHRKKGIAPARSILRYPSGYSTRSLILGLRAFQGRSLFRMARFSALQVIAFLGRVYSRNICQVPVDKLLGSITHCQLGLVGYPAGTATFQHVASTQSFNKLATDDWGFNRPIL